VDLREGEGKNWKMSEWIKAKGGGGTSEMGIKKGDKGGIRWI